MAYQPIYKMGVRVAVADVNADGRDDVVTGAGPTGGPHVQAFDVAGASPIVSYLAYLPIFTMGIYVASGPHRRRRRRGG